MAIEPALMALIVSRFFLDEGELVVRAGRGPSRRCVETTKRLWRVERQDELEHGQLPSGCELYLVAEDYYASPGGPPTYGIARVLPDTLLRLDDGNAFRTFIARFRHELEPITIATLLCMFQSGAEPHTSTKQNLIVAKSLLAADVQAEVSDLEGLIDLEAHTADGVLELQFCSYYFRRRRLGFNRWQFRASPESSVWSVRPIAAGLAVRW